MSNKKALAIGLLGLAAWTLAQYLIWAPATHLTCEPVEVDGKLRLLCE